MIRSITNAEYTQEAKSALLKLCGTEFPDPYLDPFPAKVESSLIVGGCYPDDELMKSIVTVGTKLGEGGFFMSANYKVSSEEAFPSHWYITFDEILNYPKITHPHTIQYIFYSTQGLWGIVSSDDAHSVFGGTESFIKEVTQTTPGIENDVLDFIDYWKRTKKDYPEKVNVSWMEILLKNVYGEQEAEQFLIKMNWNEIADLNKLFPFSPEYRFA